MYDKTLYTTEKYEAIKKIAGGSPMAIGECRVLPKPEIIRNQPLWLFFMAWADLIFKENTLDEIQKLYAHPYVITLNEMPGWK